MNPDIRLLKLKTNPGDVSVYIGIGLKLKKIKTYEFFYTDSLLTKKNLFVYGLKMAKGYYLFSKLVGLS